MTPKTTDRPDDKAQMPSAGPARPKKRWLRIVLLALAYAGIFALGNWGTGWLVERLGLTPDFTSTAGQRGLVLTALAVYTLLLAIPFVPDIEISLALFAAFGSSIALHIYTATLISLTIAFAAGRMIPVRTMVRIFTVVGLDSARKLAARLGPLDSRQRLEMLLEAAPPRLVPTLIKYRYVAIVLILNLPGNALVGGGGGIAMLAGMSRLFSLPGFIIAIAIAVAPVPLLAFLGGKFLP